MSALGTVWRWLTAPTDIERAEPIEADEYLRLHPWLGNSPFDTSSAAQVYGIPAFFRASRIKSDLISTLPLRAELGDLPLAVSPPILEQPDPTQDRQTTIALMVASLILRGESVSVLGDFDDEGLPNSLKVIEPRSAELKPTGSWTIAGRSYARDEVLHIVPWLLPGETRGRGALELFRRVLEGELLAQDYQRGFYFDNAQPSVKIKVEGRAYNIDEMDELEAWWTAKLRGRRGPVVLPDGIDAEAMGLSNEDAQFIETRQFSLSESALIVGVPPYFVGGSSTGMTYANVTDERRNLIEIHLRGDLYAIERGFSRLIPDGIKAKFDPTSFLRLNPDQTVETLAKQTWLTDDEKRAVMGYAPLQASSDGAPSMSPTELAAALQKIYLAVGKVISADEAREILNRAGAGLQGPAPAPAPTGGQP